MSGTGRRRRRISRGRRRLTVRGRRSPSGSTCATQRRSGAVTYYFEDFRPGQEFLSQARTITEADVVTFAGWSWDTNPVHTDAEAARLGRFGERIAHGVLGLSVALGLASRLGVFESCSIALLGVENWQFRRPLLIGDTVRCREIGRASCRERV